MEIWPLAAFNLEIKFVFVWHWLGGHLAGFWSNLHFHCVENLSNKIRLDTENAIRHGITTHQIHSIQASFGNAPIVLTNAVSELTHLLA